MEKPHITKRRWDEEVRGRLYGHGVTQEEKQKMELLLFPAFDKDRGDDLNRTGGITAEEAAETISKMRENKDVLHLSSAKIDILEQVLQEFLN